MSDCIIATGTPTTNGYIRKSRFNKVYYAHRLAYSDENGGIPTGYHVHHLCDNKVCINPDHLVALTPTEHKEVHTKLKSAEYYFKLDSCKYGHPLDGMNKNQRFCLTCKRRSAAKYRAKPSTKRMMSEYYLKHKEIINV